MASCKTKKDAFCYVCGEYQVESKRSPMSKRVKEIYEHHFGHFVNKDAWSPSIICPKCSQGLRNVGNGTRHSLGFDRPMLWQAPTRHPEDCYFCSVDVQGFNKFKQKTWKYPIKCSASRPNFVKKMKASSLDSIAAPSTAATSGTKRV